MTNEIIWSLAPTSLSIFRSSFSLQVLGWLLLRVQLAASHALASLSQESLTKWSSATVAGFLICLRNDCRVSPKIQHRQETPHLVFIELFVATQRSLSQGSAVNHSENRDCLHFLVQPPFVPQTEVTSQNIVLLCQLV